MENKVKFKLKPVCISYDLAEQIYEKGLILECDYAYYKEERVKPNIITTYGELSDDGYYELTKDGGGNLEWDEVYFYMNVLKKYAGDIDEIQFFAPQLDSIIQWLKDETDTIIEVKYDKDTLKYNVVCYINDGDYIVQCPSKKEYEDAIESAISYLITIMTIEK
jgi:hypothetical protein